MIVGPYFPTNIYCTHTNINFSQTMYFFTLYQQELSNLESSNHQINKFSTLKTLNQLELSTFDPLGPPSWSLSLSPHTNTCVCISLLVALHLRLLEGVVHVLSSSSSRSDARNVYPAAESSSSVLSRPITDRPWTLQSIPLLRHCLMEISR